MDLKTAEELRCLAFAYIKQGIYDFPLEILTNLTPHTPYDLQTIGALHLEQGDALIALDFLDKALKLTPDHAPTLLNRAKALLSLGYTAQARPLLTLLQDSPTPEIADPASALLASYG